MADLRGRSADESSFEVRDEPVVVDKTYTDEGAGQGQKNIVREVSIQTDQRILDPESDLAVQIPEGVGASTVGASNPLADALSEPKAEDVFAEEATQPTEPQTEETSTET